MYCTPDAATCPSTSKGSVVELAAITMPVLSQSLLLDTADADEAADASA
jgi:hypothetical protein